MNNQHTQLAKRREQLIAASEAQRLALAKNLKTWHRPLAIADKGIAVVRYVKHNPLLAVGASTLIAILRPKGMATWLQSGWAALQIVRNITKRLRK